MSVNYITSVIFGYKIDIKEISKNVTKYDPDTGQPIIKKTPSHKEIHINEICVCDNKSGIEYYSGAMVLNGLSLFCSGFNANKFIGIELAKVSEYADTYSFKTPTKTDTMYKLSKKTGVEPELFLVMFYG